MDAISIVSAVAGVTSACYTTAKSLHDLQGKFKDIPTTIIAISSEMTVISASLAHIQGILVQKRNLTDTIWQQDGGQRTDENLRLVALDTSLTGCLVLFSCLDQEIASINKSRSVKNGGQLSWFGRVKFLINNDRLQELLTALRGQQTAINLLIQLMQTDAISEIKKLLSENKPTLDANVRRSQSLRETLSSSGGKSVPESVLERTKSVLDKGKVVTGTDAYSHVAPSDLEFDFDDAIVNSRTYRRAMAAAEAAAARSTSATWTIQEEASSSVGEHAARGTPDHQNRSADIDPSLAHSGPRGSDSTSPELFPRVEVFGGSSPPTSVYSNDSQSGSLYSDDTPSQTFVGNRKTNKQIDNSEATDVAESQDSIQHKHTNSISTTQTIASGSSLGKVPIKPSSPPTATTGLSAKPNSLLVGLYPFTARTQDELEIAKGDHIRLLEADDEFGDGWYSGLNLRTGKRGLFPEVYTRVVPELGGFPYTPPLFQSHTHTRPEDQVPQE